MRQRLAKLGEAKDASFNDWLEVNRLSCFKSRLKSKYLFRGWIS
jgi:hypothetical protein